MAEGYTLESPNALEMSFLPRPMPHYRQGYDPFLDAPPDGYLYNIYISWKYRKDSVRDVYNRRIDRLGPCLEIETPVH